MNRVKEFRTNLGISQLALAKQIGIARQTVNLIENNSTILHWTFASS